MLEAMSRLELLAGRAAGAGAELPEAALREAGRRLLSDARAEEAPLRDPDCMKRHGGWVEKPGRGWRAYRDFCLYFGVRTLLDHFKVGPQTSLDSFLAGVGALAKVPNSERWVNCGGQLVPAEDLDALRADIRSGRLGSWEAVHDRYNELWGQYPERKARYALYTLERALGAPIEAKDRRAWTSLLSGVRATFASICEAAYSSRRKDYEDPFRRMVYESEQEMVAVLGRVEDNSFLKELKAQTQGYTDLLAALTGGK